jgi:fluoroquinolone transport system permease protein
MRLLLQTLKWDALLIFKYGIVAVAASITVLYSAGFLLSDTTGLENVIAALVFSNPVMYGFLFTAVMVLFEKDAHTHEVLAVTPLPTSYYLLSKAITFTSLSFLCSLAIILSAQPEVFHPLIFLLAVVLSSVLFIFIGVIGVSFVDNFNQFILIIPLVLAPVCLPFLSFFGLVDSWLFYLIPSQACLILFKASMNKVAGWQLAYAFIYLGLCIWGTYFWAIHNYKRRILKNM